VARKIVTVWVRAAEGGAAMGFFGSVVVARTDRPRALRLAMRMFGARPDLDRAGADGWWVTRLVDSGPAPEWILRSVARAGGGPLLCADVHDSDVARVRLFDRARPDGRAGGRDPVGFFLNVDSAVSYGMPVDWQEQARAAAEVVAWSGSGGGSGGGSLEAVRAVVQGSFVFAEDGVLRLAAAFGAIPEADLSDWLFDVDDPGTAG
jgi:hypothetical protein